MSHPASLRSHRRHARLAALLAFVGSAAFAQSVPLTPAPPVAEVRLPETPSAAAPRTTPAPVAMNAPAEPMEPEWAPALKIGEATSGLLALQASGAAASRTQRPITGELAGRSYQRYLKSFDYPIPEKFGATVKSPGLNSGATP